MNFSANFRRICLITTSTISSQQASSSSWVNNIGKWRCWELNPGSGRVPRAALAPVVTRHPHSRGYSPLSHTTGSALTRAGVARSDGLRRHRPTTCRHRQNSPCRNRTHTCRVGAGHAAITTKGEYSSLPRKFGRSSTAPPLPDIDHVQDSPGHGRHAQGQVPVGDRVGQEAGFADQPDVEAEDLPLTHRR